MKDQPDTIFAMKRKSPLAVGRVEGKVLFSSDYTAFGEISEEFDLLQMDDGDIVIANAENIRRFKV